MTFTQTTLSITPFDITTCNIINNRILIIQHSVLCVVMLRVAFSSWHAECHYAKCCYAKCRNAKCCYAKCRYAKCHFVKVSLCQVLLCHVSLCQVSLCHVSLWSVVASLNETNSSFERIFCSFSFQSFQFIFSFILFTLFASSYVPPGNPYLKGRLVYINCFCYC